MAGFTGEKKDKAGRRTCWQDGKRVPCPKEGKEPKAEAPKAEAPKAADVHADIKETLARGATSQDVDRIASSMAKLPQGEINALKKELAVKVGGKKADQARAIAEQALSGRKSEPGATKTPKGKAEAPKADDVRKDIRDTLARGATSQDVDRIAQSMAKLPQGEINALKKELAVKVGGKKADQARTIAEKALAAAKAAPAPEPVKPAEPKAPEPPPAPPAPPKAEPRPAAPPPPAPANQEAVDHVQRAVASSPGLSEEQRAAYSEAAGQVVQRMTPAAADRLRKARLQFFKTMEEIPAAVVESYRGTPVYEKVAERYKNAKGVPGGTYVPLGNGKVLVDGDYEGKIGDAAAKQGQGGTKADVYAHEFAHAIDGTRFEHSRLPEWQAAFDSELKSGQLTKYASGNPQEGWAEFGRLVLTSKYQDAVRATYPKSWAVWQKLGFAPEVATRHAAQEIKLNEIFGGRIELPDGGHTDLLLNEPGEGGPGRKKARMAD